MSSIVTTFVPEDRSNTNLSRYKRETRILNTDDEQYIETHESPVIPESSSDSFHIVTPSDEGRLDLISFHYYKTPLLWWVIAEASGVTDPFNIPIGTVLRIPELQSLYGYKGILS